MSWYRELSREERKAVRALVAFAVVVAAASTAIIWMALGAVGSG